MGDLTKTDAHKATQGRWLHILKTLGFDEKVLSGAHTACPFCKGKDRFHFDDRGMGMWYCQKCGAGDGFKLIMLRDGIDFRAAKDEAVKAATGVAPTANDNSLGDIHARRRILSKTWAQSIPNHPDLRAYFTSRGIEPGFAADPMLRWHVDLPWRVPQPDGSVLKGRSPAMVYRLYQWARTGGRLMPVTLHRTWPRGCPKKKMVMPGVHAMHGVFCPLGGMPEEGGEMGIAEGLESALSMRQLMLMVTGKDMPVWPTYSAEQMERFMPPVGVKVLHIGMDVDYSYTGQAAAYALARRLRVKRPDVELNIIRPTPTDGIDHDFNNELQRRLQSNEA